MKIMLVDDSRFVRMTVKRYIEETGHKGHTFIEASNGTEAIEKFRDEKPDIVFLDLLMPDMSGEEVLKVIREITSDCFVTMLTSNFQKPVQERLLSMGANLFMPKTITPEKIHAIFQEVEKYLSQTE